MKPSRTIDPLSPEPADALARDPLGRICSVIRNLEVADRKADECEYLADAIDWREKFIEWSEGGRVSTPPAPFVIEEPSPRVMAKTSVELDSPPPRLIVKRPRVEAPRAFVTFTVGEQIIGPIELPSCPRSPLALRDNVLGGVSLLPNIIGRLLSTISDPDGYPHHSAEIDLARVTNDLRLSGVLHDLPGVPDVYVRQPFLPRPEAPAALSWAVESR